MLADVISIFVYEVPCIFWRYISVDEESLIALKKILQSAMDSCYKLRQLFYYKVRHGTNRDRYYKVRRLLQIATVHACNDHAWLTSE